MNRGIRVSCAVKKQCGKSGYIWRVLSRGSGLLRRLWTSYCNLTASIAQRSQWYTETPASVTLATATLN
eukprot:2410856-Rhodomonas_salina.1